MESKGKRHYKTSHGYQQCDFLKHHDIVAASAPQFHPVSHSSTTKFKKGFYRRPGEKIWPGKEQIRLKREDERMAKHEAHEERRREYLSDKDRLNGNILKHTHTEATDIQHCAGRRHFREENLSSEQAHGRLIRDRATFETRFHKPATTRSRYGQTAREQPRNSTILGIDRPKERLPSQGVLDNFRGFGYLRSVAHSDQEKESHPK